MSNTPKQSNVLHEILHACSMVSGMFDTYVLEEIGETTHNSDQLYVAAERVSDAIGDLYQLIGQAREAAAQREDASK